MGPAESAFLRLTSKASQIIRSLWVRSSANFSFGKDDCSAAVLIMNLAQLPYHASRCDDGLAHYVLE